MRKIWLLALAAALLTTACRIETNILVNLNDDQTGSFGFEFGMDDEFRQLIATQGEGFDPADLFGDLGGELPGGILSERTEGDMMFSIFIIDFDSAAGFQEIIAFGAENGDDIGIDVDWTEDSVTINGTIGGSGEGDLGLGGLGDLGDLGDAAGDLGGDFDLGGGLGSLADNFFSASVIVSMPGEVGSHNADRVLSDGRLQWDVALDGSDVEITAVSSLGGGNGFPGWALVLLALVALAVILWLFSVRRRRTEVAAVEAAGAAVPGEAPVAPTDWSIPAPEEGDGDQQES